MLPRLLPRSGVPSVGTDPLMPRSWLRDEGVLSLLSERTGVPCIPEAGRAGVTPPGIDSRAARCATSLSCCPMLDGTPLRLSAQSLPRTCRVGSSA